MSIVMLERLREAMDEHLREQQAGFREGRTRCEQIFTQRYKVEQCDKLQQKLNINFMDFKKAFDSVHRESLWQIGYM